LYIIIQKMMDHPGRTLTGLASPLGSMVLRDCVLVCEKCSTSDVDDDLALVLGWVRAGEEWRCPACADGNVTWPAVDPRSSIRQVLRDEDPRERPTVSPPSGDS
jgi:hypothetical protein